jgi:hypothetical protein
LSTSCFHAPFPLRTLISFPQNAKIPKETPSNRKREKKHKNNIEGYINSYIQKSKKEAKARTRKKQGGEGGIMELPSDLEENKPTGASPVKLLNSYRQDRNTCHKRATKRRWHDFDVFSLFMG